MGTILISSSLLDREDLDIAAKMCCILLAQAAQEEPRSPLSLEGLARRMGCSVQTAGMALEELIDKGLLMEEPALELTELKTEARRVRRRDQESPAVNFQTFDVKPSFKDQLEALRGFIREPSADGTLRIILNMAGGDVERIRAAYQHAVSRGGPDTLEALMDLLQQGDSGPAPPEAPAAEAPAADDLEPETRQVLTQINQKRIAELYLKNKRKP